MDYTVLADVAEAGKFPGLACEIKNECVALHQLHYPWMLDPRLIDPCDCVRELEEAEKIMTIHRRSQKLGDAGKQHRAEHSDSDSHSEEMYCGYSATGSSDNNSLVRYSVRAPSTVLA